MKKYSGLVLVALVLAAVVAPATSSAATGITETPGTLVSTGKILTFTNVSTVTVTSSKTGNLTCAPGTVMVEAAVFLNTSSMVILENGGKTYSASCKNATGGTAMVKNLVFKKIQTTGGGKLTSTLSLEIELSPGGTTCKYSATEDAATYNSSEAGELGGKRIETSEQPLSVTPAACGTTAKLDGEYEGATAGTTTSVYLM